MMSEQQKPADGPVSDTVDRNQLLDEIENNFLTSWKSGNIKEDVLDFSNDLVPKCKKGAFNLEKLDMDFSFDGGFEKFSSFKVDISDLDFSSPSRMGQKLKERRGKQFEPEKVDPASESFTFNFDFKELDGFDLSSSLLEKAGDFSKHSLDTSFDAPVKCDDSVGCKLPKSVFTLENNNDNNHNLCSKPIKKSTIASEIIVQDDKGSSSHEESPSSLDAIRDISPKSENDALAATGGPEKTEKLKEYLGTKCSKEMKTRQSIKDSSLGNACGNESTHQTLKSTDSGHNGPSSSKDGSAIEGSTCALLKPSIPSMQESQKNFPSNVGSVGRSETVKEILVGTCSMELESPLTLANPSPKGICQNDIVHETGRLDFIIDAEPAGKISGKQDTLLEKSVDSVLKSSTSSFLESLKHFPSKGATEAKNTKIFLETPAIDVQGSKAVGQSKTAVELERLVATNGQKIQENAPSNISEGGSQNIEENPENTLHRLPKAERSMPFLPANGKYERNDNTVGRAFSLFSKVKLNKELVTNPRAHTGGTPDLRAALVHSKQKEPSSMLTNNYQHAPPHVELTPNCNNIGIKEAKISLSENEKRPSTLSTLKLSRTNGAASLTKVRKDPKLELKASLEKANTSIPEMTMSSSPSLKRKPLEGSSMRELIKSPLKYVIESPQIESRKRRKDSQIIEQKQVLDAENTQTFFGDDMHVLLSTPSISIEMSTADMEISTLAEESSTIQKAEAYAKEIEDICNKLRKMNEEAKEVLVRAVVNNNFLLLLNHPKFEKKIHSAQSLASSMLTRFAG